MTNGFPSANMAAELRTKMKKSFTADGTHVIAVLKVFGSNLDTRHSNTTFLLVSLSFIQGEQLGCYVQHTTKSPLSTNVLK